MMTLVPGWYYVEERGSFPGAEAPTLADIKEMLDEEINSRPNPAGLSRNQKIAIAAAGSVVVGGLAYWWYTSTQTPAAATPVTSPSQSTTIGTNTPTNLGPANTPSSNSSSSTPASAPTPVAFTGIDPN